MPSTTARKPTSRATNRRAEPARSEAPRWIRSTGHAEHRAVLNGLFSDIGVIAVVGDIGAAVAKLPFESYKHDRAIGDVLRLAQTFRERRARRAPVEVHVALPNGSRHYRGLEINPTVRHQVNANVRDMVQHKAQTVFREEHTRMQFHWYWERSFGRGGSYSNALHVQIKKPAHHHRNVRFSRFHYP